MAVSLHEHGVATLLGILAAVTVTMAAGLLVRETVIRPLGQGQLFSALVVTMGVSLVAESVAGRGWRNRRPVPSVSAAAVVLALAVPAAASGLRMRLVAAKSHPPAARTIGIAPQAQSSLSFAVSAACTSLAGVLLGLITGFVSPDPFSLTFGISLIAACVLGGVGTVLGAVAGGVYLTWNPPLSSAVGLPQPVMQGLVLVGVLLFLPGGVVPFLAKPARSVLRRVRRRPDAPRPPAADTPANLVPLRSPSETAGGGPGLLRLEHLSVVYGGLKAIEDASLSLPQNEILAVIGPTGAGKTTLMNALSGLTGKRPGERRWRLRRPAAAQGAATARRRLGIGRTFQHAEVFSELTVAENVLCTRRRITARDRAEVTRLLHSVGLADVAGNSRRQGTPPRSRRRAEHDPPAWGRPHVRRRGRPARRRPRRPPESRAGCRRSQRSEPLGPGGPADGQVPDHRLHPGDQQGEGRETPGGDRDPHFPRGGRLHEGGQAPELSLPTYAYAPVAAESTISLAKDAAEGLEAVQLVKPPSDPRPRGE
ncbi:MULTISPECIES: ATP-binding cassette domain-containing protein [unclassified Streptomyces]|uniref:ATP-binding cassette domain-containing protein n=1 Tax=unclassified Streptomyces TaxID=2593676 RepID=UPI003810E655